MLNITRVQLNADGWNLNILSKRVATITDPLGNRKVSYFGFESQEKAIKFQQWLIEHKQCSASTVRKAERLSMDFECKSWGVPTELILELAHPIRVQIRRLETELVGMKMHDFFPTPRGLCERLVKLAKLQSGMKVLEPSAGKGDVAQTILRYHPDVHLDVIEIQENLRRILELKGFNVIGYNFLNYTSKKWDAVIANPPFSKFCEHTYHAHKCLVSGGTLVTIAPKSVFFRSERQFKEFRRWIASRNAWYEKVPDGAFLDSINSTGVATRIVVIKKS